MTGIEAVELVEDVGPPEVDVMRAIRERSVRAEPLVTEAAFDAALRPREIRSRVR